MRSHLFLAAVTALPLTVASCRGPQPTYVRGDDLPGFDDPAMGLGLDRRDLEGLLEENMASFFASPWYVNLRNDDGNPPTIAILPMENSTTEHIEESLHALIGMVETQLVQSARFTVVAQQLREQILAELEAQQGAEFDPARAVEVGHQLGVHYFVTGRVVDNSERTADTRRVQYFMFMQVIDVETGAISWQNQAELTKGIVPL